MPLGNPYCRTRCNVPLALSSISKGAAPLPILSSNSSRLRGLFTLRHSKGPARLCSGGSSDPFLHAFVAAREFIPTGSGRSHSFPFHGGHFEISHPGKLGRFVACCLPWETKTHEDAKQKSPRRKLRSLLLPRATGTPSSRTPYQHLLLPKRIRQPLNKPRALPAVVEGVVVKFFFGADPTADSGLDGNRHPAIPQQTNHL
jgi:hypothetical protein